MAVRGRRLELICKVCKEPLTSSTSVLTDEALAIIAEQNVYRRTQTDHVEHNRYGGIEKDQVVATKCGHMFHMGCLKVHVKTAGEKAMPTGPSGIPTGIGTVFCPLCTKPFNFTRLWPVLIPPTPCQAARYKKIASMKEQNNELQIDLQDMRQAIKDKEEELKAVQEETSKSLKDIQKKQKQLDELSGPSEEELEELRKIHTKRQAIVRVVTKHNADLLEVLMHETNLQISDIEEDENNNYDIPTGVGTGTTHPCCTVPSYQTFDNRFTQESTAYGMPTDSFQEINDSSSVTFSEGTTTPAPGIATAVSSTTNNLIKEKHMRSWEAAKDVFMHGMGVSHRNPNKEKKCKGQVSVNVALGRKEGTRGICKKDVPKENKKKKKIKPEWDSRLN